MNTITAGSGDYWKICQNDPMDPRTPEQAVDVENACFICDEIAFLLHGAKAAIAHRDDRRVKQAFTQIHALTETIE